MLVSQKIVRDMDPAVTATHLYLMMKKEPWFGAIVQLYQTTARLYALDNTGEDNFVAYCLYVDSLKRYAKNVSNRTSSLILLSPLTHRHLTPKLNALVDSVVEAIGVMEIGLPEFLHYQTFLDHMAEVGLVKYSWT